MHEKFKGLNFGWLLSAMYIKLFDDVSKIISVGIYVHESIDCLHMFDRRHKWNGE